MGMIGAILAVSIPGSLVNRSVGSLSMNQITPRRTRGSSGFTSNGKGGVGTRSAQRKAIKRKQQLRAKKFLKNKKAKNRR